MRIDGNNSIQPSRSDSAPAGKGKPGLTPDIAPAVTADGLESIMSLQPYIEKAAAADEIDEKAVAQAKALLQTGQLDSPEAIARAAEAMLKRGL